MSDTIESFLKQHPPLTAEGSLAVGRNIGPWTISAFLTRGGYGEVYQAWDNDTQRAIALKFATHTNAPRLRHEFQLLTTLRHPAFPTVYGSWELDNGFAFAEELLSPYPLPTTDRTVARFITQLCEGLHILHTQGWVHRDLKPGNLMCREDTLIPVIIDLGLAKQRATQALLPRPSPLSLRTDGKRLGHGTPGYAAPEQFTGEEITTASDIHALGVLINHCFNGKLPLAWRSIVRRATSAVPVLRYTDTLVLRRAVRWRHLRAYLLLLALGVGVALLLFVFLRPTPPDPSEAARKAMQNNFDYFQELLSAPSY